MRKIKRTLRWFFEKLPNVTIFFSGFLIPVFVKSVSASLKPGTTLFSVALISFAVLSITTLLYLRIQISHEVDRSHLMVKFHQKTAEAEGDAEIYDPIIYRIRTAKRSVRVFGSLRNPVAQSSSARQRYFSEIEKIIRKKVNEGDAFIYERLVQADFNKSTDSTEASYRQVTTLLSSTVDNLTFEHCQKVLKLTENSGKVQVFLRQTPPVMPMITLVLVDDNFVILCLPWLERNGATNLEAQQLGKGFVFHDTGSGLCSEMAAMFNVAAHHSPPIYELVNDREAAEVA